MFSFIIIKNVKQKCIKSVSRKKWKFDFLYEFDDKSMILKKMLKLLNS